MSVEFTKFEENPIDQQRLNTLYSVANPGPVLILTHDNPDPDALASGKALAHLFRESWNITADLKYSGLVARAENQAMLKNLAPGWQLTDNLPDLEKYAAVALVDTQPGAGNNILPEPYSPQIVIDHHRPIREEMENVSYIDMRPDVGATVSLLYQHLEAGELVPDSDLATAMFYGIQTDTQGLSRGTSQLDQYVYFKLLSLLDRDKLIQVERAGLPRDYFRAFSKGLQAAILYEHVIVAYLGNLHRPDFVAEMADLLIRLNHAKASLCLGYHSNDLYFSLRSEPMGIEAGLLVQQIIIPPGKAGGHGTMAGGKVDLTGLEPESLSSRIINRFLEVMDENGKGEPLLELTDGQSN